MPDEIASVEAAFCGCLVQVVVAQAYALHCGRIDVCFRFTSHLNRLMTGRLCLGASLEFIGFHESSVARDQ